MSDHLSSPTALLTPTESALVPRGGGCYLCSKRAIDVFAASLVLLLCLPLLAVLAIAIKLDSKGPVFFLQDRVGWHGRPFRMFKLRSMHTDAEMARLALGKANGNGPVFKLQNDPRVTRVGRLLRRTSLDEIPQFLNVLLGQMSLVGPRPLPERDLDDMDSLPPEVSLERAKQWLAARQTVRPGITGLWQVKGRSELPLEGWIHYDLEYVRKRSLLLDLQILLLTPLAVFTGRGAL